MAGRVAGKVTLVTGAAQGLGAAIAAMLAREGAKVFLTDINLSGAETQAAAINARHKDAAAAFAHDVTKTEDWERAVKACVTQFGGLHVLVNNAGIAAGGDLMATSLETFQRVHAVDVDSIFLGCKIAIPEMARSVKASGLGGSIVNISSIAGIIASDASPAYNSAKAAVRHLSKSVALYCAKHKTGIRSNSVHPVFIKTPILDPLVARFGEEEAYAKLGRQIPLGHIGEPDDIAYAVLYLASDESKMVTGAELKVDGGISAM